jgi:hypothetical protein
MTKKILSVILIVIIAASAGIIIWGAAFNPAVNANFGVNCGGNIYMPFNIEGGRLSADAQSGLSYEAPVERIDGIDMNLWQENIEVRLWEGDTVKLEQTSSQTLSAADIMRFGMIDRTLVVESGRLGEINVGIVPGSRIQVSIPKDARINGNYSTGSGWVSINGGGYSSLSVYTASGEAQVLDAKAEIMKIVTASGRVTAAGIEADVCDIDTASGDIIVEGVCKRELIANTLSGSVEFAGTAEAVEADTMSGSIKAEVAGLGEFDANTASGDISLRCTDAKNLETVGVDTTSGGVRIGLPENGGFTLDFDSVSGDIRNSDFAMYGDKHGDGRIDIDIDSVSGGLIIEKV